MCSLSCFGRGQNRRVWRSIDCPKECFGVLDHDAICGGSEGNREQTLNRMLIFELLVLLMTLLGRVKCGDPVEQTLSHKRSHFRSQKTSASE